MRKISIIIFLLVLSSNCFWGQDNLSLRYIGKAPTSLIGDGKYIVKTTPERFIAAKDLKLDGSLHFLKGREELLPTSTLWNSTFFPGGASYDIRIGRDSVHVMYGVLPATGFTICVKSPVNIKTQLELKNSIPLYKKEIHNGGTSYTFFTQNENFDSVESYEAMNTLLQEIYTQQLVLKSPNTTLNKSVAFSQFLLDLGYNGEIMLCELFRWQDIWARDLGSGMLPGGLVSGRAKMARQSLDYDLNRYALMSPQDCKNSNDPSQGGTSSEIGWTARSSWNYYLHSGNIQTLKKDADIIRPWINHWITRDYDEDGLITDVTEFMDHMIMMLTTNGVSTLATNAMYACALDYFSKIETEIGNKKEAARLQKLYTRTVDAINTVYWNKEKEYFNSMTLWDIVSESSSQTFQSILLKMHATDDVRAKKTLDYLKKNNWCDYGSITIVPRMNHVGLENDQNVKVWPWWNLWEVEARFRCNDKEGAYKLLDLAASTIEDEKYPGLIEETLDTDGTSIGGNVFITAAGNLLEVVVKDLMGVETLAPGWTEVKVVPAVPADWKDYECKIPTPNGNMLLNCKNGKLTVTVKDTSIKYVHVDKLDDVNVIGANKKQYVKPVINERTYSAVSKITVPQLREGKTAIFYDPEFHSVKPELELDAINVESLANMAGSSYNKLIIQGNSLPLYTKSGNNIKRALEAYVNKGGTVVFYGATVNPKSDEDGAGILGEQGGIVDWYQYLPAKDRQYLKDWLFTPHVNNTYPNQKNGNYTSEFTLNSAFKGKDIYIELGALVGLDSVFINNTYVANYRDMEQFIKQEYPTNTDYPDSHRYKMLSRMYVVKAGSDAYNALKFGSSNIIDVKLYDDGMDFGFSESNSPNVSIQTTANEWQATDDALPNIGLTHPKRKGVNYWGSEQFFNSWSTKNGLFGFEIEGSGIDFCDGTVLEGLSSEAFPVNTTYTDFALFKPWTFEVLAYTNTKQNLLYPMTTERYPCIVRIVDTKTKGGYILITPSVINRPIGEEILKKLKVKL
ncbi:hypothetical protein [Dysgonomonas sp. ZJ279]|uniref:alpha-L-rhamnosidase-related protein n=1 Tax=Dysgonomonas sp. ZJ279 TaxID=2709796 RepID=UPI0013EA3842|nr:hypothetical protein [Dysgonomonas sp. ZJ279]